MSKKRNAWVAMFLIVILCMTMLPATAFAKQTKQLTKEEAKELVKPMDVTLDGKKYTLPVRFGTLLEDGWKLDEHSNEKEDEIMESLSSISGTRLVKGKKSIQIDVMNTNATQAELKDCMIFGITANPDLLQLSSGIRSDWNRAKVEKTLGKPHLENGVTKNAVETNEYDGSVRLYYEEISYTEKENDYIACQKTTIKLNEKDQVEWVEVSSLYLDLASMLAENEKKAQDTYEAPEKLTNDPRSFHFELEGTLFGLPASVSALQKDGWTLKNPQSYVRGNAEQEIEMTKNGVKLEAVVTNPYDVMMKTQYAGVTQFHVDRTTKAKVIMPGNLTIGSTEKELLKAYQGQSYSVLLRDELSALDLEKYSTDSRIKSYQFHVFTRKKSTNVFHPYVNDSYQGEMAFLVVDGKVTEISVNYKPDDEIGTRRSVIPDKKVQIKNNQQAKEFFCYCGEKDWSIWGGSEQPGIGFMKDGHFYIEWSGSDVFETSPKETYKLDAKNNTIYYKNSSGTTKIKYKILSSEKIAVTYKGETNICRTQYMEETRPDFAVDSHTLLPNQKVKLKLVDVAKGAKITGYTSSNRRVAKVSASGVVTPLRKGKVTIKATVKQYGESYPMEISFVVKSKRNIKK